MLYGHFWQPTYENTYFSAITMDVFNEYISDLRGFHGYGWNLLYLVCFWWFGPVVHIKENGFVNNIRHIDVADVNVFHDPSTPTCCFKTNAFVGSHKCTIFHKNIACSPRHLATHNKSTMT